MTDNPLDQRLRNLLSAAEGARERMRSMSRGVKPFNSVKLSSEEEDYLYDNPTKMFPGEEFPPDPAAANEMARQHQIQRMGPVEYVRWVETKVGERRVS